MAEFDYSQVSGKKVAELCSRGFYAMDGLWFSLLEEKYGLEDALDIDVRVWRSLGLVHGKRLLKAFAINKDNPIQALVSMIQADPIQIVYEPEVTTLTDSKVVFHCNSCPPQQFRIQSGKGELPCKPVGIALFTSYAELVSPKVKLSCLTCPPDPHPAQFWCEWQFEV